MTRKRLHPDDRKREILTAAIRVAARPGGWSRFTRNEVAQEAQCVDSLISLHFGTMINFRRSVMREAIRLAEIGNAPVAMFDSVIAQGLATGDKCAQKASGEVKARALASLAG